MRCFLLNITIIIGIHLILISAVDSIKPFYFENAIFRKKMELMQSNCSDCNTYFLGSSFTHRHVNPDQFDSLLNTFDRTVPMKSFNLGAPGATMLEILFITKNLLNEDLINPSSTLFIEVQPIYTLDKILSARHTYYRNPKDFNLVVGDVSIKNWSKQKMYKQYYSIAKYTFNAINGGLLSSIQPGNEQNLDELVNSSINGYVGFEGYSKELETNNRENKYQKNTVINDATFYETFLQKLISLDRIAKTKNVQIVYVLPSFSKSIINENDELIKSLNSLENFISMSNPIIYPELYLKENLFDRSHLNTQGAGYYTAYLADAYLELEQ